MASRARTRKSVAPPVAAVEETPPATEAPMQGAELAGLILRSPGGRLFSITIDDGGALVITAL